MKNILFCFFLVYPIVFLFSQEKWEEDYEEDLMEENENKVDQYPLFLGVYPSLSIPLLNFQENMNRLGKGGGIEILVNLQNSPFLIGVASTISNYGHESLSFIDNDGFELAWKTNSSLWDLHAVLQIEPPIGKNFQPYIQGKVGFNHLFTITRLVDMNLGGDDGTLQRLVDDNSWGLSYGGTIGGLIPLDQNWRFMLNPRISYLRGREVSFYAKRDSFNIVGDTLDAFDYFESTVDMIRVEVGVLVYIR